MESLHNVNVIMTLIATKASMLVTKCLRVTQVCNFMWMCILFVFKDSDSVRSKSENDKPPKPEILHTLKATQNKLFQAIIVNIKDFSMAR